nr:NADH dehydrogenase subunit 2 [Seira dowlingi]
MFLKPYDLIFIFTLMIGTMISISSNNWFTAWLGLEINLLSMIPLIINKLNPSLSESAIKYFLSQALASLFLIISSTFILSSTNFFSMETKNLMISAAIMIKAGMVPFHYWFPQVINLLGWIQCLTLFTWQKIAPLVMLAFMENKIILTVAVLSTFFGAFLGLNQNNLKLLMTYSSISHSGWMATSCVIKMNMLMFYFIIYCIISVSIIAILNFFKIKKINSIKNMTHVIYMKIFILNLLSLGGLPPLLGFLAKLSIIMVLIKMNMNLIFTILIISSLVSLFFYTRLIYSTLMLKQTKKIIFFNKFNYLMIIFLTFSTMSNLLVPMLI